MSEAEQVHVAIEVRYKLLCAALRDLSRITNELREELDASCERCLHWDEEVHRPAVTPRFGDCELDVTIDGAPPPSTFVCRGFKSRERERESA